MVTQTFGLVEDRAGEVDLGSQMQTLRRSQTNIFALVVGNTDSARAALGAAAEAELAGPSFVWLGVDGWFDPGFPEQAGPGARAAAAGALGLVPYVARDGPAWETFLRRWRSTPPPELDPGAAVSAEEACPAECRAEPPWGAAYAYDATMLVAKAWAKALDDGGDPRDLVAGDLLRALRTVQYVGVTGNVTLGARGQPAAAKYTIHQFVPGVGLDGLEWAAVGTVDDAAEGLQFFREEPDAASSTSSSAYRERPVDFGLGPGVIPEDGSHTSGAESVEFFYVPLDRDGRPNQDQVRATWYFGPRNRFGFWVDTAGESGLAGNETVCEGFRLEVDPPGPKRTNGTEPSEEALYATDCARPTEADEESLLDYLNDKHRIDSTRWEDSVDAFSSMYMPAGRQAELQDAGPPLQLSDVLCACPFKVDRDEFDTDLNVYVTWGGEPLPK